MQRAIALRLFSTLIDNYTKTPMIDEQFKHIDKQKQERIKKKLYEDPLFRVLYIPLWFQHNNDLSPVEAWQEAMMVIGELRATESDIRHLEIASLMEQLKERYSHFGEQARAEEEAVHSSMLVMATVMFMLEVASEDWKNNPHRRLCRNISGVLSRIGGFKELCHDVKDSEKGAVDDEGPLPIRDFIGTKKEQEFADLPQCSKETIEKSGLKAGNPLAVLQAIHLMKDKMTADNDWISIYAELLDREYIVKTMTSFCSMINKVFGISLNSRYMNTTLRDHGEDIDKWSEVYDDQRRHLDLVRDFRKILGKLEKK